MLRTAAVGVEVHRAVAQHRRFIFPGTAPSSSSMNLLSLKHSHFCLPLWKHIFLHFSTHYKSTHHSSASLLLLYISFQEEPFFSLRHLKEEDQLPAHHYS
ncbi:hypothetical protein PGIGA_G00065810 [Pangasianodon gigas]|uniref:Uncharacterized protein n=1 Tax=Pangasianodon gigas TaxID=30993 RepID=A0ACC5X6F2_PANGG|nr:hypothetical protein [Pangasianodon gigas]